MFDFFRKREYSNVVKFPEMKPIVPPVQGDKVFYRIGVTDNNTVTLQVGYSELTMNQQGVDNLIQQLQIFRDQLPKEQDD
jgi:hypothetical protein